MLIFQDGDKFYWESNKSDNIIINGTNIGSFENYFEKELQYTGSVEGQTITVKHKKSKLKYSFEYCGNKTLI